MPSHFPTGRKPDPSSAAELPVTRGIVVIGGAVLDDKALDRWIGQARSHVAGLPPE